MSVDPYTGKIIKANTILENGVEVIPKFAPSKQKHNPRKEHPLYRTSTGAVIGAKKPTVFDVPTTYRPTSQSFSNGFSIGAGALPPLLQAPQLRLHRPPSRQLRAGSGGSSAAGGAAAAQDLELALGGGGRGARGAEKRTEMRKEPG